MNLHNVQIQKCQACFQAKNQQKTVKYFLFNIMRQTEPGWGCRWGWANRSVNETEVFENKRKSPLTNDKTVNF